MDEETEVVVAVDDNDDEDNGINDEHINEEDEDYDVEEDFTSPLIASIVAGDLSTVRSLLKQGANKNEATNKRRTAMWHAADNGHLDIVQLLVEQEADKEKGKKLDGTPLWIACSNGHLAVARYLCEQGADENQIGGGCLDTILGAASLEGHLPVVIYLVEQGIDMEKADVNGYTPLHIASLEGHLEVTRYLLEQGADRDKADNYGYTPLHHAALYGHLEIAKLLMVYGADLNARTNNGRLPIDMGHRNNEEIKQAIRDEPRRRLDEAPGKRATEQDRHPNAAASASVEEEYNHKQPAEEGGEVADEDQDSEPSSDEEDGK